MSLPVVLALWVAFSFVATPVIGTIVGRQFRHDGNSLDGEMRGRRVTRRLGQKIHRRPSAVISRASSRLPQQ